jgi:uncharacterized protein
MTLFFPDLNVWLALSVASHIHNRESWTWLNLLPENSRLIFSWYTHLGLLRLLTNPAVMGEQTLTLGKAWEVYDRWRADPRVAFYPEPGKLERAFRETTSQFAEKSATKWVGDCYLLSWAVESDAALVTFDQALFGLARRSGYAAVIPG